MESELTEICKRIVTELDLGSIDQSFVVTPLTGGVSSDIAKVHVGDKVYCIKFALPKLKVTADWHAPVHRNEAEYHWLRFAASIVPESSIQLYGRSETLHGFVMEFLDGDEVYLWKSALLAGQRERGEAARVGNMMGRIHAASTATDFDSGSFQHQNDFYALRIEPYIAYTASRHTGLASPLMQIADRLYHSNQVLVHGDVSPKNVILRNGMPVILDAECATMGDASFDPAFCLNHLLIKALHVTPLRMILLNSVLQFWHAYRQHVNWENPDELESRICQLTPALMLARVDGKSPVEYLSVNEQASLRKLAIELISSPVHNLQTICDICLSHFE